MWRNSFRPKMRPVASWKKKCYAWPCSVSCYSIKIGSGYSSGSHVTKKKKLVQKTKVKRKNGKTLRGIEPKTSHFADLYVYYYAIKPPTD